MARLLLVAASAALLAATSAAAAVLVVRSSGPSAAAYPPGKALPDNQVLKLKANDMVVLLDSRGTRTLQRPGQASASRPAPAHASRRRAHRPGTSARRVRLGAVRGAGDAQRLAGRPRPVGQRLRRQPDRPWPLSRQRRQRRRRHADRRRPARPPRSISTPASGTRAWPADLPVDRRHASQRVTGSAQPATLTCAICRRSHPGSKAWRRA